MPITDKFGWTVPTVGANKNAWGQMLNNMFDEMDQDVQRVTTIGETAPNSPSEGDLWVDTTGGGKVLKVYQGSSWVTISAGSGANELAELTDVGDSTPTDGNILAADGTDFDSKTPDSAGIVAKTGDQTIAGKKSFSTFPETPGSAPTTDYQTANKKYVDDNAGSFNQYTGSKNNMAQNEAITITHPLETSYDVRITTFVREVMGDESNWSTLDFDVGDEGPYLQGDVKGSIVNFQVDTADTSGHFEDSGNNPVTIGPGKAEDRIVEGIRFKLTGDETWYEITSITDDGEGDDEVEFTKQDGDPSVKGTGTYAVDLVYGTDFADGVVQLNRSGTAGAGNDANTKLLLHCEGTDGSTVFTDDAVGGGHTVTANGDAQIDTAAYKWGSSSGFIDGDGDYLTIPDSANWDIFASNSDSWTIDLWVKHTDHTGDEMYITHYENGQNKWHLKHIDGSGLQLIVKVSNINVIFLAGVGEITDTDWHHVAIIKVADEYGIYKDGTQVGYLQDSDTANFTGLLYIGQRGDSNEYFAGHLDEIRVQHSNYFSASPNASLTDTIVVPTQAYGESTAAYPIDQFYVVVTTDSNQADCTDWEDINSAAITDSENTGNIFYAFSFNGRTTWGIFDDTVGDVGWRPIARNNSGTWQFNSNTTPGANYVTWTNAAVAGENTQESALEQALQVSTNQMDSTAVGAISDANWENMDGAMNGWSTDATSINVAVGLETTTSTETPSVSQITINYVAPTKWEPIVSNDDWQIEYYDTRTKLIKLGSGTESIVKGIVRIPK